MSDLITRLRNIRALLKSGEYTGADLMEAWCAAESGADRIEQLERALDALVNESLYCMLTHDSKAAREVFAVARAALADVPSAQAEQPAEWVGSIPAEESDEEFARQIEAMRRGPAQEQPASHVLVPRELTPEMAAAMNSAPNAAVESVLQDMQNVWDAAIAAAQEQTP